jgi:hypothetical protein
MTFKISYKSVRILEEPFHTDYQRSHQESLTTNKFLNKIKATFDINRLIVSPWKNLQLLSIKVVNHILMSFHLDVITLTHICMLV